MFAGISAPPLDIPIAFPSGREFLVVPDPTNSSTTLESIFSSRSISSVILSKLISLSVSPPSSLSKLPLFSVIFPLGLNWLGASCHTVFYPPSRSHPYNHLCRV
ncbi:hypothetical protein CIPAW_15G141800 [Carya illinoinensis]|uniref:Uncharacterized protein n=1 Tax=Carya illinoinensis TaxID=32201 RepID=A0A8T1NER8_CARIL|nr:hypothetical protein CIPAW_15G141800 [Carya illinoinensis]